MILVLLGLGVQLAQMLIGQGMLEEVGILLALLLGTSYQTDFLDTTLD